MLIKLSLLASQCLVALRQALRTCAKLALAGALVLAVGGCGPKFNFEQCEGDLSVNIKKNRTIGSVSVPGSSLESAAMPYPVIINGVELRDDRRYHYSPKRLYSSQQGEWEQKTANAVFGTAVHESVAWARAFEKYGRDGDDRIAFSFLPLAVGLSICLGSSVEAKKISEVNDVQVWTVGGLCRGLVIRADGGEEEKLPNLKKIGDVEFTVVAKKVTHNCQPALLIESNDVTAKYPE